MGKEGKYDLKLAEPPTPPETDSEIDSPQDLAKIDKGNEFVDVHPTTCLKSASITVLRVILLCCGIEADRVTPSAIKILASVLRDILSLAYKSDFNTHSQLAKEHHETWATLGLLRAIAKSTELCKSLSTKAWIDFLLNIIAEQRNPDLEKQIMTVRLLTAVLPSWSTDNPSQMSFLEKIFRILGHIALNCDLGTNFELYSNKCRVSLTASYSSTVVEELISLIRYLHSLSKWNATLNSFLASKLSLASDLLSDGPLFHIQLNENGGENSINIQDTVMATLIVIGGLDDRPRIGGLIEIDGHIGTICKFTKHSKILVQIHDDNNASTRKKIPFFGVRQLSEKFRLDRMPMPDSFISTWANLLLGHRSMDKRPNGMPVIAGSVNASILRNQQQQLAALNAGKIILNYQTKLRKILKYIIDKNISNNSNNNNNHNQQNHHYSHHYYYRHHYHQRQIDIGDHINDENNCEVDGRRWDKINRINRAYEDHGENNDNNDIEENEEENEDDEDNDDDDEDDNARVIVIDSTRNNGNNSKIFFQ